MEDLHKEIVLITGSSGYIGRALTLFLANRYQVIGLDIGLPDKKVKGAEYYELDFTSEMQMDETLEKIQQRHGNKIASVIHLVAYYSFSGEPSPKYDEITVNGTKNFLQKLNQYFELEQFLFSSTMLVHAPSECEITEDSLVKPAWAYPSSKVQAEKVIDEHRENVAVVKLRIAGVYDDYCHSIPLGHHIMRVFEEQFSSYLFPGNTKHGQSYLHLEDLIEAISLLVKKRSNLPGNLTLLLGEDKALSYEDLQSTFGELLHDRPWPTFKIPQFVAKLGALIQQKLPLMRKPFIKPWMIPYADDNYDLNLTGVRHHLNWEPKHQLADSIPRMIQSLKSNPDVWYEEHKIKKPFYRQLNEPELVGKTYWAMGIINIFLGLWLFSNPFMNDGLNKYEFWNDIIIGPLIVVVAFISLFPTMRWLRWVNAFIASWLMFSPLVFWSNEVSFYSNNTLISTIVLLASGYTPSTNIHEENDRPVGWSYNPSSWRQRLPIMFLGFTGFLLAKYLAAFQLGHISSIWDPFFGNGTEKILTSDVSRAFPISDAGLGALSYLLDVVAAAIGDKNRWRTMPWMVLLFGFFIIPTGVTSITLVMLQPIGVGAWCTVCLIASFVMLIMVPPSVDEVCATVQYLRRSVKNGQSFWHVLWFGGDKELESKTQLVTADIISKKFPLHISLCILIGIWLLFTPTVFGLSGVAANNIYIFGALITTFSVIAFSEVARIVRLLNVALGLWLILSAWILGEMSLFSAWHSTVLGVVLIILSLPRGAIAEHFGSLDNWVRWSPRNLGQVERDI